MLTQIQAKHIYENVYSGIILNNPKLIGTQMSLNNEMDKLCIHCNRILWYMKLNELPVYLSIWMSLKNIILSATRWTKKEYIFYDSICVKVKTGKSYGLRY